jgi:hypothetical protein
MPIPIIGLIGGPLAAGTTGAYNAPESENHMTKRVRNDTTTKSEAYREWEKFEPVREAIKAEQDKKDKAEIARIFRDHKDVTHG